MLYPPLTNKALRLAYDAHQGQFDKSGLPYIFHPLHLAEQMEDEISCCCAILHDVVEDTEITMEQLAEEFPAEVIEVLKLLTHADGVPYEEYVRGIRQNETAVKVKQADIAHNSDQSRFAGMDIPAGQLEYWRQKYENAKKLLLEP